MIPENIFQDWIIDDCPELAKQIMVKTKVRLRKQAIKFTFGLMENYDPNDIYTTTRNVYYYLLCDNKYYLAELEEKIDRNYKKQILATEYQLDLHVITKIEEKHLEWLNKSFSVKTNIDSQTRLYKVLKRKIPSLRQDYNEKDKQIDYFNLLGLFLEDNFFVVEETSQLINKLQLEIEIIENKYPPEIMALSQVVKGCRNLI